MDEIDSQIERLRETACNVSRDNAGHVERESSRLLSQVAGISRKTFSVAEDVHDAFRDLLDAVRSDEPDLEHRRGPVLHHLDRLEAVLRAELATRLVPV
jgi:hypothetical protein